MAIGQKVLKKRAAQKKTAFKFAGVEATAGAVGKYYPADDLPAPKGPKPVRNAPKVRKSISPGTVLILVAGRFRGKRVVCLKALSSGLLLVSGPYAINGVPLRRVNQKYCIATSTNVDVSGVDVSKIDDAFFARGPKAERDADFLNPTVARATETSAERKAAQAAVDAKLSAAVKKTDMLEAYLGEHFKHSRRSY